MTEASRDDLLRQEVYSRFAIEAVFDQTGQVVDRWRLYEWGWGEKPRIIEYKHTESDMQKGMDVIMNMVFLCLIKDGVDHGEAAMACGLVTRETARWTLARQRRILKAQGVTGQPLDVRPDGTGVYSDISEEA